MPKSSKYDNIIYEQGHYIERSQMKAHLCLNFPGIKWRVGKTLCGQATVTAAKNYGSNNEFERTNNLTINEIVRAAANDEKDELCNKCLIEFFDNVLPLSWELMNREVHAAKGSARI